MRSKRAESVGHQGVRTSKPSQSSKEARLRFHQPDKRKRSDQGTPELGTASKRPRPLVPQDIPGGLGEAGRTEKHVGETTEEVGDAFARDQHQETSVKDRGDDQNSNIEVKGLDTTDLARSEKTNETDKVHRESSGGNETVDAPCQGLENDMNSTKDKHLPQAIGSDQDDQDRDGKGSVRETTTTNTETDTTRMPRNEDSDLQLDMGKEDGTPESGLNTVDRESTRRVGLEMETDPPRGLDIPSKDRCPPTGIDPMQGQETGDRPDAVGDANMTTDNAPSLRNSKRKSRIDLEDSEEGAEQQVCMEEGTLQGNETGAATRSRQRHNCYETWVKNLDDTEASGQLKRGIRTGDYVSGVAMHTQDGTGRIEHLGEESEGRGHSTAMATENSRQNAQDSPEATTREQAVKEQETGDSEIPLEAERERNTATSGVQENRNPETAGDRHTEPSSEVRRRKLNDVGQGVRNLHFATHKWQRRHVQLLIV